jgi:hypothetical protein
MVAVDIGLFAWFSPSLRGLPPRPPPKNENITHRSPDARCPAMESALIVPNALQWRVAALPASAPKITPIIRRMVSV